MRAPGRYRRRAAYLREATVSLAPAIGLFSTLVPVLLLMSSFQTISQFKAKLPGSVSFEPAKEEDPTGVEELQVWLSQAGMKVALRSYGLEGPEKDVYKDEEIEIPNAADGKPDVERLAAEMLRIKTAFPKHAKAVVVCDNDVRYEAIVHVMDAVRQRPVTDPATGFRKWEMLFPDVSLSQRFLEEMFLTTPDEGGGKKK